MALEELRYPLGKLQQHISRIKNLKLTPQKGKEEHLHLHALSRPPASAAMKYPLGVTVFIFPIHQHLLLMHLQFGWTPMSLPNFYFWLRSVFLVTLLPATIMVNIEVWQDKTSLQILIIISLYWGKKFSSVLYILLYFFTDVDI